MPRKRIGTAKLQGIHVELSATHRRLAMAVSALRAIAEDNDDQAAKAYRRFAQDTIAQLEAQRYGK